jgi:PIN domain nuclease of toxin-antitoxin system
MKLLFDTHAFIWWDGEPTKLSSRVLGLCQDPSNTLILSVVSVWEMQVKHQLGKLALTAPLAELIEHQKVANGFEILPVTLFHVLHLQNLPLHHKDPFDRLLIAQAILEDALLLSNDPEVRRYPVESAW